MALCGRFRPHCLGQGSISQPPGCLMTLCKRTGQWEAPPMPTLLVPHIFGIMHTPPLCTFRSEVGLTFSAPVVAGTASLPSCALRSAPPVGDLHPHPTLSPLFCSSWVSPQILPCKQASVSLSRAIKGNPSFYHPALLPSGEGGSLPYCGLEFLLPLAADPGEGGWA